MTAIESGAGRNAQILYWINTEIPRYLGKFANYEDFAAAMPSAAASCNWKQFAYAMAKERWSVPTIERIPG